MKAVRFSKARGPVEVVDLPQPEVKAPGDVLVRIAGAGVCRTDLHILDDLSPLQPSPPPPFTLGHENAGWIEAKGTGVTTLARGDPVILLPGAPCGLCEACRAGNDMYCTAIRFPGVDGSDGGYAEYLLTSVRSVVKLPAGTDPVPLAPYADAGITAYHAVKRIASLVRPGSLVVVIGVGGLGHFGLQIVRALTPASIVAIDRVADRLEFARSLGADQAFLSDDPGLIEEIRRLGRGGGADVVLDFVAEGNTPQLGLKLLRRGGTYSIVGYGGTLTVPTAEMIVEERMIQGNFVGTYTDLVELMLLREAGRVKISWERYALKDAARALDDLRGGRILGRAVLVP